MAYIYFPNRLSSGLYSVNAYGHGPVYIGSKHINDSRRDQEEGGELDSQEEASPEEIKRREVVLG